MLRSRVEILARVLPIVRKWIFHWYHIEPKKMVQRYIVTISSTVRSVRYSSSVLFTSGTGVDDRTFDSNKTDLWMATY